MKMKNKLTPINGWTMKKGIPYAGKQRNENGETLGGIYKREFKTGKVEVSFINNGHTLSKYKFPNVQLPFQSKMHGWENLNYCGGWGMTDEEGNDISGYQYLFNAVANGTKPIGFIVGDLGRIQQFEQQAKEHNLAYKINETPWGMYEIGFTKEARIGDVIDIPNALGSYGLMGLELYLHECEEIHAIMDKNIQDYLTDWDYAHPNTETELIIVGLLLGFPIESTYAIITGEH